MTKLVRAVLVTTAIAVLAGCTMFQQKPQSELVGTWTNSIGTVWSIKSDRTFDVDLTHRGKREVWGTWKVEGDQVTLQRSGGIKPKGCDSPGIYKFERTDQGLQFTLVSDKCRLRKMNVLQPWTPWKKK